jgi:MFS family permease
MVCFLLLAGAHGDRWEIYLASVFLGAGIGLAFAAMANLIVEAVPAGQTGVATGMNTIMRTIGGAVGAQVGASILAGHLGSDGLPSETGFTVAFSVSAAALFISFLSALAVPRRVKARVLQTGPAVSEG